MIGGQRRIGLTGGITVASAADNPAMQNVACAGGYWAATIPLLRKLDFDGIGRLARDAANPAM